MNSLQQRYANHPAPPGAPERLALAEEIARTENNVSAWMALAFERFSAYLFEDGHRALAEALRCDPGFLPARWLSFQLPCHPVPASAVEAERFITTWDQGLASFEALDFSRPENRRHVWGCIGSANAFYRHYLGPCTEEQRRYGALLQRMMAALDPGERPRPLRPDKRRVLFCSPYFYQHTVARLFVPLIEALDRHRFDIHCLQFDHVDEEWAVRLRAVGGFYGGPRPAPEWRRLIGQLQADAIVYLDIGMHPLIQGLAALRLAPVQAVLWGHPVTTGLPTIDYFLSPDAMEPADGESHYTERLVRLPEFGHGLQPEPPIDLRMASGSDLICAQSIYKILPAHDALFARILAQLPEARLHLIPHPQAAVREWLRERMRPAFAAAGIDIDTRMVMHSYRSLNEFRALAASCAVNLDTIGWSGGMSSLDLLCSGLPTVTLSGITMRSRQTAALLQTMGAGDFIAHSTEQYVAQAVTLATQSELRAHYSAMLHRNAMRLYNRQSAAEALGNFLASVSP